MNVCLAVDCTLTEGPARYVPRSSKGVKMSKPDPVALNLGRMIYRLMVNPRGWRIDLLMNELGIADRTYRKYRRLLQGHFEHLFDSSGHTRVVEVLDGQTKYLRLQIDDGHMEVNDDFLARLAAHWYSRQVMHFAAKTGLHTGSESAYSDFIDRLGDKPFWLGHVLRNTDRMLLHVPDAPKDYSKQSAAINQCLNSLFFTRKLRFKYQAAHDSAVRVREICPLTLMMWRSALYVVGIYAEQGRPYLFALDRMREIEPQSTRFKYPSPQAYDPHRLFEGSFGIWQASPNEKPTDVELIFSQVPWLHRYLTERQWHPTQIFTPNRDGTLTMRFTVSSMVEVTPWIRGFGEDVVVVKPAAWA